MNNQTTVLERRAAIKMDEEVWANILLPERYIGVHRYHSQAAAKQQADKLVPGITQRFVTENGRVDVRPDHVVAQVKL